MSASQELKKEMKFITDDLKPQMDSLECKEWQQTHPNCIGCPSDRDCAEFTVRTFEYAMMVAIERDDSTLEEAESLKKALEEDMEKRIMRHFFSD